MNKQNLIILSLSIMFLITISFAAYSWSEPTTPMPNGYTKPINTSNEGQTKDGELKLNGSFYSPIFYDKDDSKYYINPSGNSVVSGTISAANPTGNGHVATKGYVDQKTIEQKGSLVCINKIYEGGGCFSCDPGQVMLWVEESGYYYYPSEPCNISYSGDDTVCSRCPTNTTQMKLRCCYVE